MTMLFGRTQKEEATVTTSLQTISQDNVFNDNAIYLTYSSAVKQKSYDDGIHIWLDGELYDEKEELDFIRREYSRSKSLSFLKNIDGCFYIVLYDKNTGKILIASDRFGLKYIYWTIINKQLVWATSLKKFATIKEFDPSINEQALKEFTSISYMLGEKTWFRNVSLIPPASILTFDIVDSKCNIKKYWWWDDVPGSPLTLNKKEAIDICGDLWIKAVQRRINNDDKVGITLSGGLDSRAIFAAIPDNKDIHAFNIRKSAQDLDYKIAESVVALNSKSTLHYEEMNPSTWIQDRLEYIHKSDGLFSIRHMHIVSPSFFNQYADINIHGFLGDAILGGSLLTRGSLPFSKDEIERTLHIPQGVLRDEDISDYTHLNGNDPFYILNRGRRFAHAGGMILGNDYTHRFPFLDYKLIDFIYSLPYEWRLNSELYSDMLLKFFPMYFKDIPWQKTGLPISASSLRSSLFYTYRRLEHKMRRVRGKSDRYCFTSYPEWLRLESNRKIIFDILLDRNAFVAKYYDVKKIKSYLNMHMKGADYTDVICTLLTFEIWMQQTFNFKLESRI